VRIALIASLLLACACYPPSSRMLIFTTYTKLGLDVSVMGGTPGEVVVGYKRFEGAIVPVKEGDPQGEAPSVFASLDLKSEWLAGLCIRQAFATGEASKAIAAGTSKLAVGSCSLK